MDCICTLCKQLIHGASGVRSGLIMTLQDKAQMATMEFDLVAAAMASHISRYHSQEAAELTAAGWLASKSFAIRFADSSDLDFATIREGWRLAIAHAVIPLELVTTMRDLLGCLPDSELDSPLAHALRAELAAHKAEREEAIN